MNRYSPADWDAVGPFIELLVRFNIFKKDGLSYEINYDWDKVHKVGMLQTADMPDLVGVSMRVYR